MIRFHLTKKTRTGTIQPQWEKTTSWLIHKFLLSFEKCFKDTKWRSDNWPMPPEIIFPGINTILQKFQFPHHGSTDFLHFCSSFFVTAAPTWHCGKKWKPFDLTEGSSHGSSGLAPRFVFLLFTSVHSIDYECLLWLQLLPLNLIWWTSLASYFFLLFN